MTASEDGTARVWDADSGAELHVLRHEDESEVFRATYSPDGRRIVTASNGWTARVWDADSGEQLDTLSHEGEVHEAAYSPNG